MTGRPDRAAAGPDVDARAVHRRAFVFDGHNDLALRILSGADPAARGGEGHLDLARMREGGLDGGIFAVWTEPGVEDPLPTTLERLRETARALESASGVRVVRRRADLDAAREERHVAAILGVEGGYAVSDDLGAVDALHASGMRCLTLTWMEPTAWADASGAEPVHGGLTEFGRRVVGRLASLGILVDLSHASDAVVEDVLELDGPPPVASHSGLRALTDHPRNLPDRLLEPLARAGGVLGVNFFPGYLDEAYARGYQVLRDRLGHGAFEEEGRREVREAEEAGDLPRVPVDRLLDHLEHAVGVAGASAVGLGSDFDGVPSLPEPMRDVRDLPSVTEGLAARGLGEEELKAVLGGNFLRVLDEVLP